MISYNNAAPKAVNNVGQFGATEGSIGAYKSAAEYAADAKYWALLSQTKYSSVEEILAEVERLYAQGHLLEEDIEQLKTDFESQEQILLGLIQSTGTAIDNTNAATELSKEATQEVLNQLDVISNMTVQTTLLPPGSLATGSYDNTTGVFSFGIPEGQPGRDGTDGTISDIGSVTIGTPVSDDYGFYVDKEDGGLYRTSMVEIANLVPSVRSISINGGEEQVGSVSFNSVSSFNTRTGDVVSQDGDYNVSQITGAAASGANSDITSISGLTTALSISQGGTGATTAEESRTNLGLGSVSVENITPLTKGGTGATSAVGARTNLGLGLVSTESIVPIAKGGTGVSNQSSLWGAIRPTGPTTLSANPVGNMDAVTKQVLDSSVLNVQTTLQSEIDTINSDLSNLTASDITLSQGGTVQQGVFVKTPQMYGAVCDGVNDDTDAFQAMLNSDPTHVIVTIPPGSILTIKRKVTFTGRRLEILGYSGIMTNKIPTSTHSQIFCDVAGDFAISCTQADVVLNNVIVKGIPAYSMGVISTRKGIYSGGGSIQTFFVTFMGLVLPLSFTGGFYSKFYQTEWMANKDCLDLPQAFNVAFFGCRAGMFNRFLPLTGQAGNGPINFYGCSFENFTNYIIGSDTAANVRYQNVGFKGCYFENFDNQSIYDGLTPRGNAAVPTDTYYNKYAYARIVVGTPWSLEFDSGCTIYLKGFENLINSTDAWAINDLNFKAKLIESDWSTHQIPLSVLRVVTVKNIDVHYNTTAETGVLACPFLTPNNTSTTPTITAGSIVIPGSRNVTLGNVQNNTLTFTSVAAGVNTYQDIVYTSPVKLNESLAFITTRSAATASCQVQLEVVSNLTLRVHVTNTWSQPATFGVRVTTPYQISN